MASPDAELIAACAEFARLEAEVATTDFQAMPGTAAALHANAEQERICGRQSFLCERIVELRAQTLEGHQARARSLLAWAPDLGLEGDVAMRLTAAILRDLTGDDVA